MQVSHTSMSLLVDNQGRQSIYVDLVCRMYLFWLQLFMLPNFSQQQESLQEDVFSRSTQPANLKHSLIVSKTVGAGLAFTSKPTQGNKQNPMYKSYIKKQSTDYETSLREVKQQLQLVNDRLNRQDREISDIKQTRNGSLNATSNSLLRSSGNSSDDAVRSLRKDFQEDTSKLRNMMYSEIDALKAELSTSFVRKNDLEFMFNKFESTISGVIQNSNVTREINQLRLKITQECQFIYSKCTKQLGHRIKQVCESNSSHFNDLNNCIGNIRVSFESMKEELRPTFFSSNQKCYSPRLVKYKELLQKMPSNGEKGSEQIVAGEVTYLLDREGYLLDPNGFYLTDKNNKQIQLDYKQLTLLNVYQLLR